MKKFILIYLFLLLSTISYADMVKVTVSGIPGKYDINYYKTQEDENGNSLEILDHSETVTRESVEKKKDNKNQQIQQIQSDISELDDELIQIDGFK